MNEKNLLEQAAETGAVPSAESAASACAVKPSAPAEPAAKPDFDPVKFTNPETGTPYTFRDMSIFDPETADFWPKMKPDGTPDLTVDGFLRKTNSGKNKSFFEKVTDFLKPKKIEHPKPDEALQAEQIIEQASQIADAQQQELQIEAVRREELESRTSAASVVAISQTLAYAIGGTGTRLTDQERKFLEGSVYRYEMVTGKKFPLPPEVSLIGDFAVTFGTKFEKPEVKKTFEKRFGFFQQKFQMIGAFLKGRAAAQRPPEQPNAPAAPAPVDFPILEQVK